MLSKRLPFGMAAKSDGMIQRIGNGHCTFNNCDGWTSISIEGKYDFMEYFLYQEAQDLIQKLLVIDPNGRFSITDILNHRWIASQAALMSQLHFKVI